MNRTLGVLISGRGSNLQALIDAVTERRLRASIRVVVSNRETAPGLDRARAAGIETVVLDHRAFPTRDDYDRALVHEFNSRNVRVVCLAGFMRKLGPAFVAAFPDAILNVHPSLLPSFPGLDAQRQALEYGVKVTGATVHFVNEELDAGPIVLQRAVPVLEGDTEQSLAARILKQEHVAYPRAIEMVLDGNWRIDGRTFVVGEQNARV